MDVFSAIISLFRVNAENQCLDRIFAFAAHQCSIQREREDVQIAHGHLAESCYKCQQLIVYNLEGKVRAWSMTVARTYRAMMLNSKLILVLQESEATAYCLLSGIKNFT